MWTTAKGSFRLVPLLADLSQRHRLIPAIPWL